MELPSAWKSGMAAGPFGFTAQPWLSGWAWAPPSTFGCATRARRSAWVVSGSPYSHRPSPRQQPSAPATTRTPSP